MSWHPEGHIEPGASSLQSLFSGNPAKAPIALLSDILSSLGKVAGVCRKGCVLGECTGEGSLECKEDEAFSVDSRFRG